MSEIKTDQGQQAEEAGNPLKCLVRQVQNGDNFKKFYAVSTYKDEGMIVIATNTTQALRLVRGKHAEPIQSICPIGIAYNGLPDKVMFIDS